MTQVASLDPEQHRFSQPFILEALEKLEKRHLLPAIELALVAVFILIIAFDAHKTKTSRLAEAASVFKEQAAEKTERDASLDVPIAIDRPPLPQVGARGDAAHSLIPIVPPSVYRDYPSAGMAAPAPKAPTAAPPPVAAAPAGPDKSTAVAAAIPETPAPPKAQALISESISPPAASTPIAPVAAPASIAPAPTAPMSTTTLSPPAPIKDATIAPRADFAAKTAAPAAPAAPTITEARLHPAEKEKALVPDNLREQKDFNEAFLSASRMLERRLTPEERAASMAPDYIDAMQRIEGFYDPTRVGPFGAGLRMQIRPGTMSMTDVFGERWTRANPDPNVHYRVGYHAETWLRPRSHRCEDFWRFRTDYSPVALEKLGPGDCAHIRAEAGSDNKMLAESSIVAAPLPVPAFAAPYPGSRMTHDELMAALRARADAARDELWYGRAQGALRRPVASKPKPAPAPADETPKDAPATD